MCHVKVVREASLLEGPVRLSRSVSEETLQLSVPPDGQRKAEGGRKCSSLLRCSHPGVRTDNQVGSPPQPGLRPSPFGSKSTLRSECVSACTRRSVGGVRRSPSSSL